MIKAVIFDLDGVLVESEHLHIEAEKQTLLKYGVQISSEELHRYTGTTASFMFTELIRRYKLNTTFKKIFDEKEKILFKLLKNNVKPTKGVMHLLIKLKRENIKLAVASSSHKKLINYLLEQIDIAGCFDFVVSSEDVAYGKPDPEIFLKAASGLSVGLDECLVIEDSKLGVEAAKKAGMKCVGYRNPHSGDQDLSEADIVIDSFSKLSLEDLLS
jgi:beta-phosphoglucomutase family hydrolase